MFKLLFLLTAFFSNQIAEPDHYQVIIEEVKELNDSLFLAEAGDYRLFQKNNQWFLISKTNNWIYSFNQYDSFQLKVKDENALIFYYYDQTLSVLEINKNGKKVTEQKIFDNPISPVYDIVIDDDIFIVGSLSNYVDNLFIDAKSGKNTSLLDAFVAKIGLDYQVQKIKIYGGVLNESFHKVAIENNNLVVAGFKDPLSGGDFGNGGKIENSILLAKLDKELEMIDYRIFTFSDEIFFISFQNDYLYLGLKKAMIKVDCDLNPLFQKTFDSQIKFLMISPTNKILAISEKSVFLYDLYDFKCLKQIELEIINSQTKCYQFDKIIYLDCGLRSYFLDIAFLHDFVILDKFYRNNVNQKYITTLFGEANLISETSEPVFNPQIFGLYCLQYEFTNMNGNKFIVTRDVEVLREVNVIDNMIYPTGYKLKFTGYAFLNGKSIANNYSLDQSGEYCLELYGQNNELYEIKFFVQNDQIKFESLDSNHWHYQLKENESFYLDFSMSQLDLDIESIIINGEKHQNFVVDNVNGVLSLRLTSSHEAGLYYLFVEKINYYEPFYDEVDLKHIDIKQMVVINVLKNSPSVSLIQNYQFMLFANVNDVDKTARLFEVKATSNSDEVFFYYPLSTRKINLHNLKENEQYQVTISLCYDLGNFCVDKVILLEAQITGGNIIDFADIEIVQKTETLNSFKIIINDKNKNLNEIKVNEQLIFKRTNQSAPTIVIAMIGGGISLIVGLQCKKMIKVKRFKKNKNEQVS